MNKKHIVIDARIRQASTGRYIDKFLKHLQYIDQTNQYIVLVSPNDDWEPRAPNFYRQTCKYSQFSFNPIQQIGFTWQLYRLLPDLVHFSMTQQPIMYFGKIITTTHDLTMLRYMRAGDTPMLIFWIKLIGYRFLLWWGHRKSKFILTPSHFVAEDMAKYQPFAKKKIISIHLATEPPIPAKAVTPSILSTIYKLQPTKTKFIFYVGTAFPHKNLDGLVKAFEKLVLSNPKLKLILVGKKEKYYEELEVVVAKSPAKDSIIITGFIPDEQLKWLYEHAQAYVFPSLSEGFGLPGLEAMVHGCPVVSSNATCLPEVYGDAAIYFDPNNTDDMADKIQQVITDKKLRKSLITKGHAQANKYSWNRMATQTHNIYLRALKS